MKIDKVRRRGKTITITGNFQRSDLREILKRANAGEFDKPPTKPAKPANMQEEER